MTEILKSQADRINSKVSLKCSSESFGIVISEDVVEHVEQPEAVLEECKRVLKKGGAMCISFGPLYYSPWGAHLYDYINFPWPQLLFSQETLIDVVRHLPSQPHIFSHQYAIERLRGLNKITLRKFSSIVERLDMKVIYWEVHRKTHIWRIPVLRLSHTPVIGNLFIGGITCILEK